MTLSGEHMILAIAAAAATVAAIVWMAPSWQAGLDRLTLVHNTLGIAIVFAGWAIGLGLFAWGVAAGSKGFIYFSFMPMVLGGLMYKLITRRHQTWYGVFGFDDSSERWRSFWDETRKLWGLAGRPRPVPGAAAQPPRGGPSGSTHGQAAGTTRRFSASFGGRGAGAGASVWAPIITFAATRLASGHIVVFPNSLEYAIVLDPAGNGQQPHLDAFRQSLVVRRHDGGHLQLAVQSDLAFLIAAAGPRRFDGSYTITVGLDAAKLRPGRFSGSLVIDTGDPVEPQLTVPVAGAVT